MASAGPNYGGTITGNTGGTGATVDWTNPGNTGADDGSLATCATPANAGGTSRDLIVTNLGFALPGGAIIDGIVGEIERQDTFFRSKDIIVQLLIGGALSGTNKADTSTIWGTLAIKTYGGTADKWGLSPTQAQINASNFGILLRCASFDGKGASGNCGVDFIRITVYYSISGGGIFTQTRRFTQAIRRAASY